MDVGHSKYPHDGADWRVGNESVVPVRSDAAVTGNTTCIRAI